MRIGVFTRGMPLLDHAPEKKAIPGSPMNQITNLRGAVLSCVKRYVWIQAVALRATDMCLATNTGQPA
jgi:hypothetical protein